MRALPISLLLAVAPAFAAAPKAAPKNAPAKKESKDSKPKPAFGSKPYGILLLGQGGGAEWDVLVTNVLKTLKGKVPFQALAGPLDSRALQRSIDALQAQRLDKLVVVGLYLDSSESDIDQLKYLLGMRQLPSEAYLEKWGIESKRETPLYRPDAARKKMLDNAGVLPQGAIPRVKAKVPMVLAGGGLDADACVSDTLLLRVKELGKEPKGEAVVLLGEATGDEARDAQRRRTMDALAHKLKLGGGYSMVRALLLPASAASAPPGPKEDYPRSQDKRRLWPKSGRVWEQQDPEDKLRAAIRSMSVRHKVLVVPYLLEQDGSERAWRKRLDNLFFQWKGKGILPSKPVEDWVLRQAAAGEKKKDMVEFKDPGQTLEQGNGRK